MTTIKKIRKIVLNEENLLPQLYRAFYQAADILTSWVGYTPDKAVLDYALETIKDMSEGGGDPERAALKLFLHKPQSKNANLFDALAHLFRARFVGNYAVAAIYGTRLGLVKFVQDRQKYSKEDAEQVVDMLLEPGIEKITN